MDGEGDEYMPRPKKIDTAIIGIVITIVLQCSTMLWWAATMNTRVEKLESDVAPVRRMETTMAVLDVRTAAMERTTRNIEAMLFKDKGDDRQ